MATATIDDLVSQTQDKANVASSNFATRAQIIVFLNEALRQFRELVVTADDSYYQATLDFSITAQPGNVQALPSTFWKMRGLDGFAGDSLRQAEVYAREFRERFAPGIGYYFGADGNSIVISGVGAEQANPYRLYYTPDPLKLADPIAPNSRSIAHNGADGSNVGQQLIFINGAFSAGDTGGTLVISGSGTALDGTYTITSVVSPTNLTVQPLPTPSLTAGGGTSAVLTDAANATRTFSVVPTGIIDKQSFGTWILQNGAFGAGADLGSFLSVDVDNNTYDGFFTILQVSSPTNVLVTPAIESTSPGLTGTATVSRQPGGTRNALDVTEDRFVEYFSVRAAQAIARKKRQDTLAGQLAAERAAIEDRIAALARMRQSEPQQAPVLWGRRRVLNNDDLEV